MNLRLTRSKPCPDLFRVRAATAILAALTALLLARPYMGVWHDSTLYLGQVLALLHPESFRHDLFFAYGSQGEYTLFPRLLAPLLAHVSADRAFLWLTLACLCMFLWASHALLSRLLPKPWAYAGLLALALLPKAYSMEKGISYAEPFLTGRSMAEPLLLGGLALLLAGQRWPALLTGLAAAALHPLQALPAFVVAWAWLALGDRRWWHAAWSAVPAVLVSLYWPDLARHVWLRFDPAWYAELQLRDTVTFYFSSGYVNSFNLLTDVFLLGLVGSFATPATRRFVSAVLVATALLMAACWIANSTWLAWFSALQLWRVAWLAHWTAMATLPWLCLQLWRRDRETARHRLLLFAALLAMGLVPSDAHPLLPAAIALYLALPRLSRWLSLPSLWMISGSIAVLAAWHLLVMLQIPLFFSSMLDRPMETHGRAWAMVSLLLIVVGLFCVPGWQRLSPARRGLGVIGIACLFLLAACTWDRRPAPQRQFTQMAPAMPLFGVRLHPADQVLWPDGLLPTWNLMHAAHYLNLQQIAGGVFNRATSEEGHRRKRLLEVHDRLGKPCPLVVHPRENRTRCQPDEAALLEACRRTAGELDYVVSTLVFHVPPRGSWKIPKSHQNPFHLYACADMLQGKPIPTVSATPP